MRADLGRIEHARQRQAMATPASSRPNSSRRAVRRNPDRAKVERRRSLCLAITEAPARPAGMRQGVFDRRRLDEEMRASRTPLQPHHAEQIDDADAEAVEHAVFRDPTPARPMIDRHRAHHTAGTQHQRREEIGACGRNPANRETARAKTASARNRCPGCRRQEAGGGPGWRCATPLVSTSCPAESGDSRRSEAARPTAPRGRDPTAPECRPDRFDRRRRASRSRPPSPLLRRCESLRSDHRRAHGAPIAAEASRTASRKISAAVASVLPSST